MAPPEIGASTTDTSCSAATSAKAMAVVARIVEWMAMTNPGREAAIS